MSFFANEFNKLRTKDEFEAFVSDATTHQQTSEFTNVQAEKSAAEIAAIRCHICKIVTNHFNNPDQDKANIANTDLYLYIGNLSQQDRDGLVDSLIAKNYYCTVNATGDRVTISITNPNPEEEE